MTDAANSGEQKKSSPVPWILGGCGCLLAGIGVVVLGIFFVVMKATEEPEKVVTEFLSASAAGDADRAYGCFDPELQQVQSLDEFRSILSANPQLFDVDVAAVNYTKRGVENGTATFVGTVPARAGGELPISFTLRQTANGWKMMAWNIGTPPS
ncbi:MAG: hypothetical protein NDJ92_08155 [Thermoanaerobaculia bacterium]|nr:hypothetical protein [Thermoanaerobaculia bacterium]